MADEPKMKVSQKEMMDAQVPLAMRDYCAHVLIPLNKCRRENIYMKWACEHEKHSYEICLFKEYERRKELRNELNKGNDINVQPNSQWKDFEKSFENKKK